MSRGMLAPYRKGQSRDALRATYAAATDAELVTHARCAGVTVAKHGTGMVNRFCTIERLVDTLAPLPEIHGP